MIRLIISLSLLLLIVSCNSLINDGNGKSVVNKSPIIENSHKSLERILTRKKLVAVTDYGPTSYFIYRGQPMGYQYELLKKFTDYLGVELELKLEVDLLESMDMLDSVGVDLIAMGLTVTNERKEFFTFTNPILTTRQVLVQRKPEGFENMATLDEIESHLIRNTLDLAQKNVYVEKGTVYKDRLLSLANSMGDEINIIEDEKWTDKLINSVANGEIDYTIADEHLALVSARQYKNIDVKTAVSFPQKISWAAKNGQQGLVDTINYWLKDFKKKLEFRLLYNKYYINRRSSSIAKSTYNSYSGNKLSPYDETIKKYSSIIGWDWRLIASLMYQESDFKPTVKSWVGAFGLMQLMPTVLKEYGLDTTASPEQQIEAGIRHLKYKESQVPKTVTDSLERIKFTLASYNSGVGHILDARRLAEKYGKNPNVWDNNVAEFVLKLSDKKYYHDEVVYYGYMRGDETFNLVSEVMYRYSQYKNLIHN
jgi:membrane-bound lytic murein transglycosylase F